jgi:hypothetical protein
MRALLPWRQLDADPPEAYVDFVARHVAGLRRSVLDAIDDRHRAELLYPEVLTDVALAWRRLESARQRGRSDAAGDYLDRCLQRRLYGPAGDWPVYEDPDRPAVEVSFVVWDADRSALPHLPPPDRVNAAVRLAGQVLPLVDPEPAPLAEAAIAWWHAYEQRRRWRAIAVAVLAGFVVLLALGTASTSGATF